MSSGRATHSSRIGAPVESSAVLDQVKEGLLGPLDVVYQHRERFGCGSALEASCETPRRARPATSRRGLAEKRGDRRCSGRLDRPRVQLFQGLDHRPVGDSIAVGQATTSNYAPSRGGEELLGQP